MQKNGFHHALKIQKDVCVGCSRCMNVCPTEAIRIKKGKAELFEHKCIDCGECFKACPVNAIIIEQDDFNRIFEYKHRVALLPSVLLGQFSDEIKFNDIYKALFELGFTDVFEVEHCVDVLNDEINNLVNDNSIDKPLLSSFCPAIIRLIQVKFPSLVNNIVHLRSPLDISALYYRDKLINEGIDKNAIGLFYITPCAAKIASVKSPVGDDKSIIDGVINMDFVYNKVQNSITNDNESSNENLVSENLSSKSILWSLTNGEASNIKGRSFAIDGINNVIEFLEDVEDNKIKDVDFIELRACDESCAGGVLSTANRFLTVDRLKRRAEKLENNSESLFNNNKTNRYLIENIKIVDIKPRSMMKLDENMDVAINKMKRVEEIMSCLPNIDCGVCGAPNCRALAEDIVQNKAVIDQCIFIQKNFEKNGIIDNKKSYNILKDIWGEDNLNNK
ncbi:MAG: [Fe-Fe] hydrogenase large subunit C-terminal domain-containing protein, partial [Bacteroidota bacterium]|nr:[Fe-Fe] hydrogenase large subunit C-terminal domain-containing protein [Bacteroidota bacterium]